MDFENRQDERRDWREERRRWKEERQRRWQERGKYDRERWMLRYHSRSGNVWTGIFLLAIGGIALAKTVGAIPQEFDWLWSWQMLLIGIGFFLGVRHGFRGGAWLILMVIGGVFIMRDFYGTIVSWQYLWPSALILLGLFIILRPRRHHRYWKDYVDNKVEEATANAQQGAASAQQGAASAQQGAASTEDYIDSTSIFGGVKKNVISKNFRGGDITNIMGGSEIDLTQADINGTVTIDLTQIFGGTKLIVPSNWQVKAQMAAIFGGVEDKRSAHNAVLDPNKTLILDGTSIFGGIEIKSY